MLTYTLLLILAVIIGILVWASWYGERELNRDDWDAEAFNLKLEGYSQTDIVDILGERP